MGDEAENGGAQIIHMAEPPKRPVGRPPRSETKAKALRALNQQRLEFVDQHPLVQANPLPKNTVSAADRLNMAKHQMAKEVATLEFNRGRMDLEGKETSALSTRIVQTLKKIADLDLEVKKLGHVIIDPRSEEVQVMVRAWLETLTTVISGMVEEKVLPTQTMDLLFSRFGEAMEGWEDRVAEGD